MAVTVFAIGGLYIYLMFLFSIKTNSYDIRILKDNIKGLEDRIKELENK